jgi:hypothetical protein
MQEKLQVIYIIELFNLEAFQLSVHKKHANL